MRASGRLSLFRRVVGVGVLASIVAGASSCDPGRQAAEIDEERGSSDLRAPSLFRERRGRREAPVPPALVEFAARRAPSKPAPSELARSPANAPVDEPPRARELWPGPFPSYVLRACPGDDDRITWLEGGLSRSASIVRLAVEEGARASTETSFMSTFALSSVRAVRSTPSGRNEFVITSEESPELENGFERELVVDEAGNRVVLEGTRRPRTSTYVHVEIVFGPAGRDIVRFDDESWALFDARSGRALARGRGRYTSASVAPDRTSFALARVDGIDVFGRDGRRLRSVALPPATSRPRVFFAARRGEFGRAHWDYFDDEAIVEFEGEAVERSTESLVPRRRRGGRDFVCAFRAGELLLFLADPPKLVRTEDGASIELDLVDGRLVGVDASLGEFLEGVP